MDFSDNYEDKINSLFEDLGEIETGSPAASSSIPGLIETLHEQEGRLDPQRLTLVRLFSTLALYMRRACSNDPDAVLETCTRIAGLIQSLSENGLPGGRLVIRHRGRGIAKAGPASQNTDYVLSWNRLFLDAESVKVLEERLGPTAPALASEFEKAAIVLFGSGITNLVLNLSEETRGTPDDPYGLKVSGGALCACFAAIARHAGTGPDPAPGALTPMVINDEYRRPDPNFTLLAVANGLRRGEVQVLVNRLSEMMKRAGARDPLLNFTSLYEAVFAFRKITGALKRPALEVNHVRWLLAFDDSENLGIYKAAAARLVSRHFGPSSFKSARILGCLAAGGGGADSSWQLADRLGLFSELLDASAIAFSEAEENPATSDILPHDFNDRILAIAERFLANTPDEVYDMLSVEGEFVAGRAEDCAEEKRCVNRILIDLVLFFRQRSATNRKMKSLLRHADVFDDKDYEVVARDFGVSVTDATELVGLLTGSFDSDGHFLRQAFERSIPAFCRHEKKVFGFLWYYLKEHVAKEDRIALLNALALLANRIRNPEDALKVLLEGYLADGQKVYFSDRNALILANILVRKFNKELLKEIRMTPEEVLRVKDGLDRPSADFAAGFLDDRMDDLFIKTRSVHKELSAALNPYTWHDSMPLGYLLTLERETYIFFSLVGGAAARTVLRSALWEYGNPDSAIYGMVERPDQMAWLFHLLQVVVRGVGRVGEPIDAAILMEIKTKREGFLSIAKIRGASEQVKKVMAWVDGALESLEKRGRIVEK